MRLILTTALAAVLLSACSSTDLPTSATTVGEPMPSAGSGGPPAQVSSGAAVTGRVVDFQSRAGFEGAVIEWGTGDKWTSAKADASGAFSLTVSAIGMFDVRVAGVAPAFSPATVYVSGRQFSTVLLVGASDCPRMYGWVFDARTSLPVAGAKVSWIDTESVSKADGSYEVDLGCRAGGYGSGTSSYGVAHSDYQPQMAFSARREWVQSNELHRRDFALVPR